MNTVRLPTAEIGLIAATRGMLGAGIGLLAASRLSEDKRSLLGKALLAAGVLSTIPLAFDVLWRRRSA